MSKSRPPPNSTAEASRSTLRAPALSAPAFGTRSQPRPIRSLPASSISWPTPSSITPPTLARALGERAGAVAGGLHRGEERRTDLVDLELAQRRGGGAGRRGHLLAQHGRV